MSKLVKSLQYSNWSKLEITTWSFKRSLNRSIIQGRIVLLGFQAGYQWHMLSEDENSLLKLNMIEKQAKQMCLGGSLLSHLLNLLIIIKVYSPYMSTNHFNSWKFKEFMILKLGTNLTTNLNENIMWFEGRFQVKLKMKRS